MPELPGESGRASIKPGARPGCCCCARIISVRNGELLRTAVVVKTPGWRCDCSESGVLGRWFECLLLQWHSRHRPDGPDSNAQRGFFVRAWRLAPNHSEPVNLVVWSAAWLKFPRATASLSPGNRSTSDVSSGRSVPRDDENDISCSDAPPPVLRSFLVRMSSLPVRRLLPLP